MPAFDERYSTSRSIFGFVENCAWIVLVFGLLLAALGLFTGGLIGQFAGPFGQREVPVFVRLIAMIPGLATAFVALGAILMVQFGRAAVETAAMTHELLEIARRQERRGPPETEPMTYVAPAPKVVPAGAAGIGMPAVEPDAPVKPRLVLPEGPDGWRRLAEIAGAQGWKMSSGLTGVSFMQAGTGKQLKVSSVSEAIRALDL